jgi:hypothetical protein
MMRVFAVPRSIAMSLVKKSKNAMYVKCCLRFKKCVEFNLEENRFVKLHLIYQNIDFHFKNVSFLAP